MKNICRLVMLLVNSPTRFNGIIVVYCYRDLVFYPVFPRCRANANSPLREAALVWSIEKSSTFIYAKGNGCAGLKSARISGRLTDLRNCFLCK